MDLLVIALSFDKNYVIKFLKGGKISDKEMVCQLILKFPDMGLLPVFQTLTLFFYGRLVMENQFIFSNFNGNT